MLPSGAPSRKIKKERIINVMAPRVKFASQADAELLEQLRLAARTEGKQLQAVMEEAFRDYLDKKSGAKPRPHIMALYERSLEKFGPLYERLAK